jgi:hypothetical protein
MVLSPKQTIAFRLLTEDSHTRELLYGGSAGGGKSILGCTWQIHQRLLIPKSRGVIVRQVRKDIYATVMNTFQLVAQSMGAGSSWTYQVNEQKDEIQFSNGSIIYLRDGAYKPSDPLYDRLKLEVTDAWIEEGTQVDERAYIAIRPRIRYMITKCPKLLITSNPGECWVKWRFVKNKEGKIIGQTEDRKFIDALVSDNPDKKFVEQYTETLNMLDEITKQMMLYGNWDVNLNDNPFFYSYNHYYESSYEVSNQRHLDISFDFNVSPTTAVIGQHIPEKLEWHVFDVITADTHTFLGMSPIQSVCKLIDQKYRDRVPRHLFRITGDATGKSGSADRANSISFYSTIQQELQLQSGQIKVRTKNLPHPANRTQINHVLHHISSVWVYSTANRLHTEIGSSWPDDDGTLNKAKDKHGLHTVDAWRYLMDFWFPFEKYREMVNSYLTLKKAA